MSSSGMFLIGGDFNINIGNNTSSDASKFLDLLESRDLKQHVVTPTHEKGFTLQTQDSLFKYNGVWSFDCGVLSNRYKFEA